MFTWICPQCGKEVPPHENECPYCKEGTQAAAKGDTSQPPTAVAAPPTPPAPPAPQPPPSPAQPQAAPQQPVYEVGGRRGAPGWLVALLMAAILLGAGFVLYKYALPSRQGRAASSGESPFEEVPEAGGMARAGSQLSRYIEATGFRITESPDKRIQVQFLVVNHSAADLGDLAGTIHLKSTESDKTISSFDFKTSRLGPYESIEFKAIMSTTMRAYELPDWQFLRADVEITSPSSL